MRNENDVYIGDTRVILETHNERDEYIPHLFISKDGMDIMLNENEILAIRELTKEII